MTAPTNAITKKKLKVSDPGQSMGPFCEFTTGYPRLFRPILQTLA